MNRPDTRGENSFDRGLRITLGINIGIRATDPEFIFSWTPQPWTWAAGFNARRVRDANANVVRS